MPNQLNQAQVPSSEIVAGALEGVFAQHPFTRGLSPAYLRRLASCGKLREFPAGHYLWRQGDRNVEAFLILEGKIALEITVPHEGKLTIEAVSEGEVAGCTALFHSARWGFDGRALTGVQAVVLSSNWVRAAIDSDREFGYQLLERCTNCLGKRLNASRLKLVEAHSLTLP